MRRSPSSAPRARRTRRAGLWLGALGGLAAALGTLTLLDEAPSHAQDDAPQGPPVFHEFVPELGRDEGTTLVSGGGEEPAAIVYEGEILEAPEGGGLRSGERAMRASPGDGAEREEVGRRSPTFRPDRITELAGTVGYYEVFTPTISPFKRVTALDSVVVDHDVPVLSTSRGPRTRLSVEGASSAPPDGRERDRFWGSVVVDFSEGREVPFPSVSPESRILTLRTEPPTPLHLERDSADNFYAVLDDPAGAGEVRVVFLTDAPRTYFGTELPGGPADALAGEVPRLPARVQRDAETFAAELGLSRSQPFDAVISALVGHFRSFEESAEPPTDTGAIYLDLARGMRGVCRHRAYGFVITARALGIHARFVQNEAHAWVEVHLPERRGWLRIDLGGSARGLATHNADDRPAYRPEVVDTLPRPEPYERAYAEARRMSEAQAGAMGPGSSGSGAAGGSGGASEGTGGGTATAAATATTAPDPRGRDALELRLSEQRHTVFRGRDLEIVGTARSSGGGIAGLRVEVLLSAPRGARERLLGVTVTRDDGSFHTSVVVPPDVPVGEYRLVVRSPGNDVIAPATAQ